MPLDQPVRPTPGGYEIHCGPTRTSGTLGATVLWEGLRIGITNAHILPFKGEAVFQPNCLTHRYARKIGNVEGVSAGRLYPNEQAYFADVENREDALYDFAYFQALPAETSTRIAGGIYDGPWGLLHGWLGIDPVPLQLREPKLGEEVRWIGKATAAVRTGRIVDLDHWGFIQRTRDPDRFVGMAGMIRMEPLGGPSQAGDSGAALVATTDQRIVGLYCGATADEKFDLGSKIPANAFELGSSTPVSQELARERYEKYRTKPKEQQVLR
ncbi:hypothetical protein [Streptomyces sp. NPDC093111]|uniref:hypothetical protein n=1 Tax=Streptomyces sp. NPDC093111 TaxID=3154978 RepID=UPI00341AD745